MRCLFHVPVGIYGVGEIHLQAPQGAQILGVEQIYGSPALVFLGNPSAPMEPLALVACALGGVVPEGMPLSYVGKVAPPGFSQESALHIFAQVVSLHR